MKAVSSAVVESGDISRLFDEYVDAFAARGRVEKDTASLLGYYSVPELLAPDLGYVALTNDDQVLAALRH